MFGGVDKKLERAGYFLDNLESLEKEFGNLAHVAADKQQEMRANLDGYFFEVISAKDFFLQGINNKYKLHLPKTEATKIERLKAELDSRSLNDALKIVIEIEKLLSDTNSWLWRLNNYRNSATHRELLHLGIEQKINVETEDKQLFNRIIKAIKAGKMVIKPILEGQEKEIQSGTPLIKPTSITTKTFLFKDPENPELGNADLEVIPYCRQSLEIMREFLDKLYSKINI